MTTKGNKFTTKMRNFAHTFFKTLMVKLNLEVTRDTYPTPCLFFSCIRT